MGIHTAELIRVFLFLAPYVVLGAAMITFALMRRDGGRWWQLLAAAGAVLISSQLVNFFVSLITPRIYDIGLPWWVLSVPQLLLALTALCLLLAAVLVDRPRTSGTARTTAAVPPAPRG